MVSEKVVIVKYSDGSERSYTYSVTEQNEGNINEYGIVITKEESFNGQVVDTIKSEVKSISSNQERITKILNLLSKNEVSPIHLIDVVTDYIEDAC